MTFCSKKGQRLKFTCSRSVKLRSGLHGLAPFLSELVLEPLLAGGCRLTNLPELSLKVGNMLFSLLDMSQLVGPALGPLR
jgi:hypothetical protein